MSGGAREIFREIDDVDGFERALLNANTATDAETLRNPRYLGVLARLDAELASAYYRAKLFALLIAFLRLAPITADDGNTEPGLLRISGFFFLLAHIDWLTCGTSVA